MKRTLSFLFTLGLFVSLQAQATRTLAEYRSMFWDQIAATCAADLLWEKSVQELDPDSVAGKETHVYKIDCQRGVALNTASGTEQALNFSEFDVLFDYDFANPFLTEYLHDKSADGNVDVAVKYEERGSTPLRRQVFKVNASSGKMSYAEIDVLKASWLYEFGIRTRVWFDVEGHYLRHEIETRTSVIMSGVVHTRILGRRLS